MFDAYRVAVRLSIVGGAATALAGITAAMRQLNTHAQTAQRGMGGVNQQLIALRHNLTQIRAMTVTGGALTIAGGMALGSLAGPLKAAKEYELAQTRFKTLNLGEVVNRQADVFARGAQKFGVSSTVLMDALRESYGFFGNMKDATAAAGKIAELNAANSVLFGGRVAGIDGEAVRSLMRAADMRGATNSPAEFFRTLDLFQKMVTGSGGAVKFNVLEQLAKTGGTAFKTQSDEGLLMLASIMQEQGGPRTGTALMSLYQNLIAGRTTKVAMGEIASLGLGRIAQEKVGELGGKTQTRNRLILNDDFAEMLRTNSAGALMRFVLPAITKDIESKGMRATDDLIAKRVNDILSNRTASNLGVAVTTQMIQVLRDAQMVRNAQGVDQTIGSARSTLGGNLANLQARWNSLLTELGITILPAAIKGVEMLNSVLAPMARWARENPGLAKGIVGVFGALGALAVAGGGLMLIAGGIKAVALAFGVVKGAGLAGAVASILGPVGLAITALGLLAAAAYAFKPLSRGELDSAGGERARLTPEAAARARGMGWEDPFDIAKGRPFGQFGPRNSFLTPSRARRAAEAMGMAPEAPPQIAQARTAPGHIFMDGRRVGEIVSAHQARELTRAPTGPNRFDPTMGPVYPGQSITGAW